MKEIINELRKGNYDAYFFFPGKEEGQLLIQGSKYKDAGEKLDYSEIGDCYHIVLFREDEQGNTEKLDNYEAILVSPLDYMQMLIPQDWYGMICKKTTTSSQFVQIMFDKLKEV